MALVNCYECKKEVSDKASFCPHCGAPQKPVSENEDAISFTESQNGFGALDGRDSDLDSMTQLKDTIASLQNRNKDALATAVPLQEKTLKNRSGRILKIGLALIAAALIGWLFIDYYQKVQIEKAREKVIKERIANFKNLASARIQWQLDDIYGDIKKRGPLEGCRAVFAPFLSNFSIDNPDHRQALAIVQNWVEKNDHSQRDRQFKDKNDARDLDSAKQAYCMKNEKIHFVETDEGKKAYVSIKSGRNDHIEHPRTDAGYAGLFVFAHDREGMIFMPAGKPDIREGKAGVVWNDFKLIQLGKNVYGWTIKDSYIHHGWILAKQTLYIPFKGTIIPALTLEEFGTVGGGSFISDLFSVVSDIAVQIDDPDEAYYKLKVTYSQIKKKTKQPKIVFNDIEFDALSGKYKKRPEMIQLEKEYKTDYLENYDPAK